MSLAYILIVVTMGASQATGVQGAYTPRFWPVVEMQRVESLSACQELAKTIQEMVATGGTNSRVNDVKVQCKPAN